MGASGPDTERLFALLVLGIPLACLSFVGFYLQCQGWRIYHRIGNYAIGVNTFFWQLGHPGLNFPGPNVLEAQIAKQPADLQAYIGVVRQRRRAWRRALRYYLGFVVLLCLAFYVRGKLSP